MKEEFTKRFGVEVDSASSSGSAVSVALRTHHLHTKSQHGHLPKSKQHGPFLDNFKVERLGSGGGKVVVREGSCHKFIQTQSEVSKNINMRQSEFFRGPFTVLLKQNFHSTPASHPHSFEHAQRILCTSCFSEEYACLPL